MSSFNAEKMHPEDDVKTPGRPAFTTVPFETARRQAEGIVPEAKKETNEKPCSGCGTPTIRTHRFDSGDRIPVCVNCASSII